MTDSSAPSSKFIRPGKISLIAVYLFLAAQVTRTLERVEVQDQVPWYLGLLCAYILLYTVVLWQPGIPSVILHGYFLLQSAITLKMLALNPEIDFATALFVLLSYQAALVFNGLPRWLWVGSFVLLSGGALMFFLGALQGLAFGLIPMAGCIILPALVFVNQAIETAQAQSQALIGELQETQRKLQLYSEQVEDLASMQERNRLARQLHDSVSQTMFSITLNIRSAQMLLEQDPARLRPQLEGLKELAQGALSEMRSLISKLRL